MSLRVVLVLVAMEFSFFGLCGCHERIGWLWIFSWTNPIEWNIKQVFFIFFFFSFLGYSRLFQCCSMIYIQVLVGFRFLSGTSLLIKGKEKHCRLLLFVCLF